MISYDISATISDHVYARTSNDVYVQIIGTAGSTEELMCPNGTFLNTYPGGTVNCAVNSDADIGKYTCVTWRLDGIDGLEIAEFTTSIDGVEQETIVPADGWIDDTLGNNGQIATWCKTGIQ